MSFDSHGSSQPTQSQPITLGEYLENQDDENFTWDELGREIDEAWNLPVQRAGLDPKKHKVFHHQNKEYLRPPLPFIQHGERLGESGSTLVYKVTCPDGYNYRRPLALKVIVCNDNSRPPGPDSIVRLKALEEVQTMASVKHPHIVVYVASFEDYCISTHEVKQRRPKARAVFRVSQQIKLHVLGIAMYPPAQCNLRTFMEQIIEDPANIECRDFLHTYFGCLAQAVAFLHKANVQIRHKDIKPENVVIDEFLYPVLTDFGLSKHFEAGQHSSGPTGKTLKYADPEAIHETKRDERSDVFSLGCVFLEMATTLLGRRPSFAEQELNCDMPGVFKYSECLDRLDSYLLTLSRIADSLSVSDPSRKASAEAIKQILPHIRRMMDEDHRRRPFANDLYPLFRHMYDVSTLAGPCLTCEGERMVGSRARSPVLTRVATTGGSTGAPIVRRASTLTGMAVHHSPIDTMEGIETYEGQKYMGNGNGSHNKNGLGGGG
ncbi:kinase-like domain-containing protein [Cladorrhinum sp. PSN259]|nr:kinase-like domain-containing protein [Cladorrhinum sp. PSN259]